MRCEDLRGVPATEMYGIAYNGLKGGGVHVVDANDAAGYHARPFGGPLPGDQVASGSFWWQLWGKEGSSGENRL
jgi:hypothetical protein